MKFHLDFACANYYLKFCQFKNNSARCYQFPSFFLITASYFLSDFNQTWIFSAGYSKNLKRKISSESVQWDPSWSLLFRDRQKYVMKLKSCISQIYEVTDFSCDIKRQVQSVPCNDHAVNSKYHAIPCEIETQSSNRGVASLTGTAKVGHPLEKLNWTQSGCPGIPTGRCSRVHMILHTQKKIKFYRYEFLQEVI